jgi:biopolymer transport protein TolR
MPGVTGRRRPMSEINVVPYIDVMLVLLVIFMVTAPLLTQGIQVDLPRAAAAPIDTRASGNEPPLVVSIDRDGLLYLNRGRAPAAPLDERTLGARVTASLRQTPELPVYVKGDRDVRYGRVVETMVLLQSAGARKIGFLTEPRPRDAARQER